MPPKHVTTRLPVRDHAANTADIHPQPFAFESHLRLSTPEPAAGQLSIMWCISAVIVLLVSHIESATLAIRFYM